MMHLHASCVAVAGAGVLLRGPSGAGKSDLALRLIDGGARLVADDQVELSVEDGRLLARAPAELSGLLEVRGFGIIPVPPQDSAEIMLLVDLVALDQVERLPEQSSESIAGIDVPRLALWPFAASAPAKVRLAAACAAARVPWLPAPWPMLAEGDLQ